MAVPSNAGWLDVCGSIFRGARRFYEYEVSLLSGNRAMLNTSWNNEHFSWAKAHFAISHFDCETALEDEKEIVGIFVFMPRI